MLEYANKKQSPAAPPLYLETELSQSRMLAAECSNHHKYCDS